ncbi:Uncharacterised protein [Burkholderia pseudomallei]|nr:Uncharacterised protein [Burkholderia pseudomallei]CAK0457896.1 Uncharacterised protein [Burkholderia pseudomallei]
MTAPGGSKQLVQNPLFAVNNSNLKELLTDGKNDNYVSSAQSTYPPPDQWTRAAGGLRIENVLDPLMTPYLAQLPKPTTGDDPYNVVVLAGSRDDPNDGNGALAQSISLERGGEITLTFYSIRNPYVRTGSGGYSCPTTPNQYTVTFGPGQDQSYIDIGNGANTVTWVKRLFNANFSQPGSYDLNFGPSSEQQHDKVHQDCASVIAYPQMYYTYAAYAKLMSPSSSSDITAAPGEAFPEIDVQILEGDTYQYSDAPGTLLPNAMVVFQIQDPDGTGTQFTNGTATLQVYANDHAVAVIPGGQLVAGPNQGNVTLNVLVADDVAATFAGTVHADFPSDGEVLQVLSPSGKISMSPLSRYESPIIFRDVVPHNDAQGVPDKLLHVEIRQGGRLVVDPNGPYFDSDGQQFNKWQGKTNEDGELTITPTLCSGAQKGEYQVIAFLDGYPKCNASVELDVIGVAKFDPASQPVSAIRKTNVIDHWSLKALDAGDNPAAAQPIYFTIVPQTGVVATFLGSGAPQAVSISNPETGVVTVPPLWVPDESGSFIIDVSDAIDGNPAATITVEVLDPQCPDSIAFDTAPPDLTNAAGEILKEGKIGVYVWANVENGAQMISGRLDLKIDDTSNTGTTFYPGTSLTSYADIIDGYAQVPAIQLGGTAGTFNLVASMNHFREAPTLTLRIGPK